MRSISSRNAQDPSRLISSNEPLGMIKAGLKVIARG